SFQKGEKLQSIRIIHRADEQGEVERLVSLSGVEREFIRTNDLVTCIYPEGKRPQANRKPLGHGFPSDLLSRMKVASAFYQLTLGQHGRVAAYQAQELVMKPVDQYRYGYRLWIEKENALLLQADLISETGKVLEKFSFSSVDMNEEIADLLLQPQMIGNEMSWNRKDAEATVNDAILQTSKWQITWMPDGFKLTGHQNRFARNGSPLEQRIYSDGLSSVSIFIEKIRAQHGHLKGGSKMGSSVNAYGSIISAHYVTVVGEVPAQTVEKIGTAIQYAEDQ
ncbi:MAG: MucB/RseB C-terminal domain-containing protein, partial [Methylophaga sp.]|nr:MucB/RseB C-terminal domain-containing protein [Methylophaga sp.]